MGDFSGPHPLQGQMAAGVGSGSGGKQSRYPANYGPQYDAFAFDMSAMASALPQQGYVPGQQQAMQTAGYNQQAALHPPSGFQGAIASAYMSQGLPPQPHQYHSPPFDQHYSGQFLPQRQPLLPQQWQSGQMRPYSYGMNPAQHLPANVPFGAQTSAAAFAMPLGINTEAEVAAAPVPSYPRGPPRKPKQSGFALWVGNLPPNATVTDLKDHFSRDAVGDIQSVFLIAKSNCAFVNYRSEAACAAAMNRFHDSRFNGTRLVCRLRRGSVNNAAQNTTNGKTDNELAPSATNEAPSIAEEEPLSPTIVRSSNPAASTRDRLQTNASSSNSSPVSPNTKVPERFFIVKSLTMQDLEASVRKGIWATQPHNEATLNDAFASAENVYLIFSANKSGEYFGYARMTSAITGDQRVISISSPTHKSWSPSFAAVSASSSALEGPQSIPTPATATAPKGHIVDDSARGTIFWEAVSPSASRSASPSPTKATADQASSDSNAGRVFNIEWLSTARLPFFRTRGLRNPWNANREVKIARDGTELETQVGKRLIAMFMQGFAGSGLDAQGHGVTGANVSPSQLHMGYSPGGYENVQS